jgi:dCMP deaminase
MAKQVKETKRDDYLTWDEYFMGVALLSAQRSKDPSTRVGACIINDRKRIVGIGYNGLPIGCPDDVFPWDREGDFLDTKYPYVCHAELNAILNAISTDLAGCSIYTTLFPCNECAKVVIQSGITEVVYLEDKYAGSDSVKASRRMFDSADVSHRQLAEHRDRVVLDFEASVGENEHR